MPHHRLITSFQKRPETQTAENNGEENAECLLLFMFLLWHFAHHKIRKLFPLEFSLEQHSNYLIFFQQLTFLSQTVVRPDMFGFF